jgi:NAD(P)-dependent dehydrogenase (short-subunit alcohol dehydrogenase family)
MPSYVVIGASRGLGYAFLEYLSKDPNNIVIGTARKVAPVNEKVQQDGLKNVTIVEADMVDRASFRKAAAETAKLTGGAVDYLILNAVYASAASVSRFLDEYEGEPDVLEEDLDLSWKTNVVGFIDAINAFLPLVKKGSVKKVLSISTGMADFELCAKYEIWESAPYSISKAALNAAIGKYAARYGKEGILFLSISPGVVDTGNNSTCIRQGWLSIVQ